jgi:crossover junction endodeoxyribonuclease RuvC
MRVLGIDPSSQATGYGILESTESGPYDVLAFGTIKPKRRDDLPEKLLEIKSGIDALIVKFEPHEIALENPFYAQNVKTAITLGQVRGAILVAVAERARPLFVYAPLEIKKAVTGYGQADKGQVNAMVRTLLHIEEEVEEDAADALACALCHLNTRLFQKRLAE